MSVDQIRDVAQSRLTFKRDNAFHKELRRRVDEYFRSSDRSPVIIDLSGLSRLFIALV